MEMEMATLKAMKAEIDSSLMELAAKADLARQLWLENEDISLNDEFRKTYLRIDAKLDCLSDISDRIQNYLDRLDEIDTL